MSDLIRDIREPVAAPPNDTTRVEGGLRLFSLEEMLPISLIRTHTKTDDVPFVTDEQLRLYRKTAFEASQRYSALLCGPIQQVIEFHKYKRPFATFDRPHVHGKHDTQYPVHAPYAYVWRGIARDNKPIRVKEGQRRIKLPLHSPEMFLEQCCDPCSRPGADQEMQIMYYAGYKCVEDVPSGIVLGMLQFIAWVLMHPGDELLTQRNRTSIAEAGVTGTNNIAWASGALELWVQYDDLRY